MSRRARAILSDPSQARELIKQSMMAQRDVSTGRIVLKGEAYQVRRVGEADPKPPRG
jgi:hypothetical protein